MDDFALRKDWEERKEKYFSGALLNIVASTDFLTALTLLSLQLKKLPAERYPAKIPMRCSRYSAHR